MFRFMTPVDFWKNAVVLGAIAAEAQMVIAMRLLGGLGVWNVDRLENVRMVAEKAGAVMEAGHAASSSVWKGHGPGVASLAVLKPIRKRTRSNVRRLHRRGPKTGIRR